MSERDDLLKEYRRLAKKADQRLVRLEAYQHDKGFKTATKWAYSTAMKDIKRYSGPNARRFNTKPPENINTLKAKIQDIRSFIDSPSSTKKGIVSVYKKKADTINKKYGTKFTWEDLANYYLSGTAEKLDSKYGSKTALESIGEIQKLRKKEVDLIQDSADKYKVVDDNIVNKAINEILKNQDLDILSLI